MHRWETELISAFSPPCCGLKTTCVHGCTLFLTHVHVCATHTTRSTRTLFRFLYLHVCDMHTHVRTCTCQSMCSCVPRQPFVWTTPLAWRMLACERGHGYSSSCLFGK